MSPAGGGPPSTPSASIRIRDLINDDGPEPSDAPLVQTEAAPAAEPEGPLQAQKAPRTATQTTPPQTRIAGTVDGERAVASEVLAVSSTAPPQPQQFAKPQQTLRPELSFSSLSSGGPSIFTSSFASSTPSLSSFSLETSDPGASKSYPPAAPAPSAQDGGEGTSQHLAQADGDHDEQEDLEAVEQAEEGGSIVVDDDDLGSDAGYGSDSHSAASTSIASSVRDYMFENGRRYHKFREGRYNFPNDEVEQEREDMKHAMVKLLCQQLHFAPIGDNPQQILDIGTGTGMWVMEMAEQFSSATVLGVDLSPIQPDWIPPNVRFMVDDVESPWLYPRNHFDYIHSRHTVMAIKNWPLLFRRALEHVRPGGWMELQEVYHYPISANDSMRPEHPVAQYWSLINHGLANLGVNFHISSGGRLAAMMRECGFTNVTERVFHVPLGTWPKNKVLKTVGLYWRTILLDGIQAIALGPLTRGCGWTREQVEVFLVDVRRAYHDNSCLMYMPLHIVYGQKPQYGY